MEATYISPIGLLAGHYSWPTGGNSVEFFLKIEKEAPSFFWANQFWFENGNGGYIGLQTDGTFNGRRTKVAIFSIWDAINAKEVLGGLGRPFGHEGDGYQCLIEFEWKENINYRLRVLKVQDNWWEALVLDTETKIEVSVGKINTPSTWAGLKANTDCFVENFGRQNGQRHPCVEIPTTLAHFLCPTMEDGNLKPNSLNTDNHSECQKAGIIVGNAIVHEDKLSFTAETGIANR